MNGSPLMNSTPYVLKTKKHFIKPGIDLIASPIPSGTFIEVETKNSNKSPNVSNNIQNLSQLTSNKSENSIKEGEKLFQWIIFPINVDTFFK